MPQPQPQQQPGPELPESDAPRPHGDTLEEVTGNDAVNERGKRPDRPAGPTGDMDQPGMNPAADLPD